MAKYTAKERRRLYQAFKAAKPKLSKGVFDTGDKYYYICYAIANSNASRVCKDLATDLISKRLEGYVFLTSWLAGKVPKYRKFKETAQSWELRDQEQLYRHRWLDALIEEFSE